MKKIIFWLLTAIVVTAVCSTFFACDKGDDPIPEPKKEVIKVPTTEVPANSFFQTNNVSNFVEEGIEYIVVLVNDDKAMSIGITPAVTKAENVVWDVGDVLPYVEAKVLVDSLNRNLEGKAPWKNLQPWLRNEKYFWKADNADGMHLFIDVNGLTSEEDYAYGAGTASFDFENNQNLIVDHNLLDEPIELSLGENGTTGVVITSVVLEEVEQPFFVTDETYGYNPYIISLNILYSEIRADGTEEQGSVRVQREAEVTISGYEGRSDIDITALAINRDDKGKHIYFEDNMGISEIGDMIVLVDGADYLVEGFTIKYTYKGYDETTKLIIAGQELEVKLPQAKVNYLCLAIHSYRTELIVHDVFFELNGTIIESQLACMIKR